MSLETRHKFFGREIFDEKKSKKGYEALKCPKTGRKIYIVDELHVLNIFGKYNVSGL